jgi:hypothetical protein
MSTGIQATYINENEFSVYGNLTDLLLVGRNIKADCGVDGFKYGIISTCTFTPSGFTTEVLLKENDALTSNLDYIWYESEPHMSDGRPIVRSDTRPLNTQTYWTGTGDSSTNIGDGVSLKWDFSNDDDLYTGSEIPSGFKAKEMKIKFLCPVYLKDGTIYFFDASWDSYLQMDIMAPSGSYYPNPAGVIPASALGLNENRMYALASEDTPVQRYVNKQFMYRSCPMGDELNAEGASVEAVPVGWYIRGLVVVPESDVTSKGYASLEMYRCHSVVLPGETISH